MRNIIKFQSFQAYWLSPDNKAIPVPLTHIHLVTSNPEKFGFKKSQLEKIFRKYNEPYGHEGFARDETMTILLKKNWIRLRYIERSDQWKAQLSAGDDEKKRKVLSWLKSIKKKGYPYSEPLIIDLNRENVAIDKKYRNLPKITFLSSINKY